MSGRCSGCAKFRGVDDLFAADRILAGRAVDDEPVALELERADQMRTPFGSPGRIDMMDDFAVSNS